MTYIKQNDLLLNKLLEYYKTNNNMNKMLSIINGESRISLRIVDWFATNYAKKHYTVYTINSNVDNYDSNRRFKVYVDYKLNLKAYSKKRFDPFCRWDRIIIPYDDNKHIQTTIGQLNFFKWALENNVVEYIENNYSDIEADMNSRNSTSKRKTTNFQKTRKKREELSISATKSIKREEVEIVVEFN
tara:strand:- start:555 stop:1115 length:561 start_codon:yes stop_codon:yes gene_type:complete